MRLLLACFALAAALLACNAAPPVVVVHGAGLAWTDLDAAYVTSYNVYRAAVSGGPYTLVGSTSAKLFLDSTAAAGSTNYYVVTAVAGGTESVYSDEVMVTVP